MVKNIGVDIIENDRFIEFLEDDHKLQRILSSDEINCMKSFSNKQRKLEYIASRFAAKEALVKAGLLFTFNEISILNDENGKPFVKNCNKEILISISHNKTMSIAFVIVIDPCFVDD